MANVRKSKMEGKFDIPMVKLLHGVLKEINPDNYKCECGGDMKSKSMRMDSGGRLHDKVVCDKCGEKHVITVEPKEALEVVEFIDEDKEVTEEIVGEGLLDKAKTMWAEFKPVFTEYVKEKLPEISDAVAEDISKEVLSKAPPIVKEAIADVAKKTLDKESKGDGFYLPGTPHTGPASIDPRILERRKEAAARRRAAKEAEERARKEAEERARKEAEERAVKEAEERAAKEAEDDEVPRGSGKSKKLEKILEGAKLTPNIKGSGSRASNAYNVFCSQHKGKGYSAAQLSAMYKESK